MRDPLARARDVSAGAHLAAVGLVGVIILLCTTCSHAGGESNAIHIEHVLAPDPPVVGFLSLELALTDRSGAPTQATSVSVEGNMTHPGMVPSPAVVTQVGPGRYRANLELTMPGDWVLLAEITLPDGTRVEHSVVLPGVRIP
jgi:YtkA-like protein